MKCSKCGTETKSPSDAFCTNCGAAIEAPDSALSGAAASAPAQVNPSLTTPVTQYAPELSVPTQPNAAYQPAPTAQMPTSAPMMPNPMTPAPAPAPAPAKQGGVSPFVVGVLVGAIVVLVILLVILVVKPFGGDGQKSSSASPTQSSVTVNSSASAASSSSAAADTQSTGQGAATGTSTGTSTTTTTDPEANHGLPSRQSTEVLPAEYPFYGVWIGAFSVYDNAVAYKSDATSKGLPSEIYETTDWENLNPTHYWVVSIGRSTLKSDADALCEKAHAAGFTDAYVKYTGNHK